MEETYHTKKEKYEGVADLIENAKHIAVIPSKMAGTDAFSSAVGMYYILQKKGKQLSFIYPGKLPELFQKFNLIDPAVIKADTSSRSLLVSIDYSETPAARVQYSNENNVLQLEISPVSKEFDLDRINARVAGFDFDLVITFGVQSIEDLGPIFKNLETEFGNAKVINIDNKSVNGRHGAVNIIDTSKDNLSLIVFDMMAYLGLTPDSNAAKALLIGMTYRESAN